MRGADQGRTQAQCDRHLDRPKQLDEASLVGEGAGECAVRVKRRDGQVFVIQPDQPKRSPLDVPGIDTEMTTEEIVGIVREMRQRVGGEIVRRRSRPTGKQAPKSKRLRVPA